MSLYKNQLDAIIRDGWHEAIRTTWVTVSGGVAQPLPSIPLSGRKALAIKNSSGATIWVGASGVNNTNGWPIGNGGAESFSFSDRLILYGYTTTTRSGIYVMEVA